MKPYFAVPNSRQSLAAALLIAATAAIGYGLERTDTLPLLSLYGLLFAIYGILLKQSHSPISLHFFIITGVLARLALLFAFPNLSDDIYRFVWDGRLIVSGLNPFDRLPSDYINQGIEVSGLNSELFVQLNSPNYFTVYPPVAQAVFGVACWLSPNSVEGAAVVMKLVLLLAEVGTIVLIIKLLRHFELPPERVLIYALNPLLILEICGNLHFEGLMIFFLMLAFWQLVQSKNTTAALAMALSIAAKLLPLLFFPFLIRRMGWWRSLLFFCLTAILVALSFTPLLNSILLDNFGASLNLYFRQFEFNASIYYIARWIGQEQSGQNLIRYIGPALAALTALCVFAKALLERRATWQTLPPAALFAISIYLLFATTVHPWYLALPLVWCLFTKWRYPVIWSGLIFLTYAGYSGGRYQEVFWPLLLEYLGVLAYFVWEVRAFFQRR